MSPQKSTSISTSTRLSLNTDTASDYSGVFETLGVLPAAYDAFFEVLRQFRKLKHSRRYLTTSSFGSLTREFFRRKKWGLDTFANREIVGEAASEMRSSEELEERLTSMMNELWRQMHENLISESRIQVQCKVQSPDNKEVFSKERVWENSELSAVRQSSENVIDFNPHGIDEDIASDQGISNPASKKRKLEQQKLLAVRSPNGSGHTGWGPPTAEKLFSEDETQRLREAKALSDVFKLHSRTATTTISSIDRQESSPLQVLLSRFPT